MLETTVVPEYRAARSTAGRIAAMASAAARPGRIRRHFAGLDAIHFPLSVMLPPVDTPPASTTVLDVQHEVFPEFFSRAELAYRRRVYGWTVKRSRIVITISEHARQALIERYDLDPDRVVAIHLAVDHARFTPDGSRPREPFLLYPANAWPHKNHARLFEAFARVRAERPELRLVLTGAAHDAPRAPRRGGDHGPRLARRAGRALPHGCRPRLPEPLRGLRASRASRRWPAAARWPHRNVASLPEICGDAAVYFDPLDPESIADGIRRVLDSPPPGGEQQAARFTWERVRETARRRLPPPYLR